MSFLFWIEMNLITDFKYYDIFEFDNYLVDTIFGYPPDLGSNQTIDFLKGYGCIYYTIRFKFISFTLLV